MPFPVDQYTPFGYLHSPDHTARSWDDANGGMIRTSETYLGMGWAYVHPRRAVFLCAALALDGLPAPLVTRSDWAAHDLHASHHSSQLMEFRATLPGGDIRIAYFRLRSGVLVAHALIQATTALRGQWGWLLHADRVPGAWQATGGDRALLHGPEPHTMLRYDRPLAALERTPLPGAWEPVDVAPGETWEGWALLTAGEAPVDVRTWWWPIVAVEAQKRRADDAFWDNAPRLEGDWPPAWRRGWVYDLETTRGLMMPPGGIFGGEWPTWMAAWPRAVLAEGVLDLDRLGLAAPIRAQDALLTLLRDTPGDQIPCVFRDGTPNMVAVDGTVCGTSPAWCLPFLHIARLLRRQPDPGRIGALAPYLARYLRWWLAERTDRDGWLSYHCTWEAGEDDNPRLDPDGTGDGVIQGRTRPVELQAAMALSADVLRDLFTLVGETTEATYWETVAQTYRERTQSLWDGNAGRFRDWDVARGTWIASTSRYWETDSTRFSPLALIPALLDLSEEQRVALRHELHHYDTAPWRWWASWSTTLCEVAAALGEDAWAATFTTEIAARVYHENDRRIQSPDERPTPGVAREYWPEPLVAFTGNDAYGWGAETLPLVLRHVIGWREDETAWHGARFTLVPGVPPEWRGTYTLANVQYRGIAIDITYTVSTDGTMTALIVSYPPLPCSVIIADGTAILDTPAAMPLPFPVQRGVRYAVVLGAPSVSSLP